MPYTLLNEFFVMAIMGVACKLAVPRFIPNMMQNTGSYLLEPGDNTRSQ